MSHSATLSVKLAWWVKPFLSAATVITSAIEHCGIKVSQSRSDKIARIIGKVACVGVKAIVR